RLADGSHEKLADGLGGATGLAWDKFGRLFISDAKNNKVFVIGRPGDKPVQLAEGLQGAAGLTVGPTGRAVLVVGSKAGTITPLPAQVPGAEVDDTPLPLEPAVAFPDLQWSGWEPVSPKGLITPFRPILLTHAGDGSNRVFVATQQGVVHVFPN